MKTISPSLISPAVYPDLEEAARYAASGVRDPEVMREACERMDTMREELRKSAPKIAASDVYNDMLLLEELHRGRSERPSSIADSLGTKAGGTR